MFDYSVTNMFNLVFLFIDCTLEQPPGTHLSQLPLYSPRHVPYAPNSVDKYFTSTTYDLNVPGLPACAFQTRCNHSLAGVSLGLVHCEFFKELYCRKTGP